MQETADNLVITPHIGGACRDAMASTERFVASKLTAFLRERAAHGRGPASGPAQRASSMRASHDTPV